MLPLISENFSLFLSPFRNSEDRFKAVITPILPPKIGPIFSENVSTYEAIFRVFSPLGRVTCQP